MNKLVSATSHAAMLVSLSLSLGACGSSGAGTTSTTSGAGGMGVGGEGGMGGPGGMGGAGGMAGSGGMGSGGSMAVGCPGLEPIVEPAETLYVAADGNDMAAGTKAAPLATLGEAAKRFPMGGTIIVRGGVYPHQVLTAPKGTVDHPLVIRAETGETPIFDGMNQTLNYRGTLHLANPTNVVLWGLEVRNATGANYGAGISNGGRVQNLRIRECHLHHINGPVARFTGEGIIFEGNDIHDGVLVNSKNQPMGGWPTCIGTQPDQNLPADPWTKNIVIRNNHIRDCWGEGIGLFYGMNAVVEDNVIERTWNVGIYADNATDVTISRNFVHMVDGMAGNPGPGSTILIGMENYEQWGLAYQPTKNINIVNNVAIGRSGAGWFDEANASPNIYFDDITIAHNTFVTVNGAIRFGSVQAGKPLPTKIVVKNNFIAESKPSPASTMFPNAFQVSGNAWVNEALPPLAGATDVSLMGVTLPGNIMSATDFQSLAGVAGSAASSASVPIDYLCAPRSSSTPTPGAFEKAK